MSRNVNLQDQEDEICVLSSIYTKEEFESKDDYSGGQFYAFVTLPHDFVITYKNYGEGNESVKVPLSHLPPITLTFKYPANYPSEEKPEYQISCLWLSITKLNKVCEKLDKLWEENRGTVILYIWTQFLKEDLLEYLGMSNNLDLCRQYSSELRRKGVFSIKQKRNANQNLDTINNQQTPRQTTSFERKESIKDLSTSNKELHINRYFVNKDSRIITVPLVDTHLHKYLISFNEDKSRTEFLRTLYTCDICYEDKLGEKCIQFKPCNHVYCKQCLQQYFEVRISEGQVNSMPCPQSKCKSEAQQHQIKETVGSKLYLKYDNLLLNATLDTMVDITYCPRSFCGCPVMRDTGEKMATCPKCEYVFCVHCKMTYHGVEKCRLKAEKIIAIMDEYEQGDEQTKFRLEKIYGKKEILSYINIAKSENWIKTNSKLCPNCKAAIEKMDGCNKMACTKCKIFFCWICLSILDPEKPYRHFDDTQSACFNQLFQGVDIEDNPDMPPFMNFAWDAEDDDFFFDDMPMTEEDLAIIFNVVPNLLLL
ncbi:E3 ubiquitin-protein ligase RNF14-like [Cimex lectularius]|uniref:RBR-type E3 ubiquitin transferase n=1 Tax=Cimex lectularius TaxID=79782 RepID=A0A8I6S3I1_CIMLE|nr:E3 ubiquitin-protein ligase RNF14-like [Cimex lectularius]XP_014255124.1 E3 ubiquitin-protein ligase RNF14-like [Cimex lectularius]